jgi:hypothetical protein
MHIHVERDRTLGTSDMKGTHILGGKYIPLEPDCPYEFLAFNYSEYTFWLSKRDNYIENESQDFIISGSNKYYYSCASAAPIIEVYDYDGVASGVASYIVRFDSTDESRITSFGGYAFAYYESNNV